MIDREHLIEKAENAIEAVFNDRSVSQKETAEDLEDLQVYIDIMLSTLGE